MDREKNRGIPTTWKKIVWKILASRNTIRNGTNDGSIGKIGIYDHSDFIVSTIVCKHDGRTYLVESDCRIRMDNDGSRRKRICGTFRTNDRIV